MDFFSQWWAWGVLAVVLAVGEVLLPTYVLLGFSIGAGIMMILSLLGLVAEQSWPVMVVVFAVLSLLSWMGLRRFLGVSRSQVRKIDHDINE